MPYDVASVNQKVHELEKTDDAGLKSILGNLENGRDKYGEGTFVGVNGNFLDDSGAFDVRTPIHEPSVASLESADEVGATIVDFSMEAPESERKTRGRAASKRLKARAMPVKSKVVGPRKKSQNRTKNHTSA